MTNSSSRRLGATNSSSWLRGTSWIWSVCPRLPGSSSWLPWWRHSSALFFSTTSKEMQRESRIETEPSSSSPWACHSTLFKTSSWFSQTNDLCSWEKPTTTCIPWARTSGPRFILSSRRLSWPQQSSAQSVTTWLDSAQYSGINSLPSCWSFSWFTTHLEVTHWSSELFSLTNNLQLPWLLCWLFPSCSSQAFSWIRARSLSSWLNSSTCQFSSMVTRLLCSTSTKTLIFHAWMPKVSTDAIR